MSFYNPVGIDHTSQQFDFNSNSGPIGSVRMQNPTYFRQIRIEDESTIPIDTPSELVENKDDSTKDLDALHRQNVDQFVGGPPTPLPPGAWRVRKIELVGLVKNDHPVVYISDQLVEMTDLKNVPKRELDRFEAAGLEKLQGGEDLFARRHNNTVRLFGSVRAQKDCLSCHDGGEGKLLGAFSYTLRNSR
jgi:hypothetical protein